MGRMRDAGADKSRWNPAETLEFNSTVATVGVTRRSEGREGVQEFWVPTGESGGKRDDCNELLATRSRLLVCTRGSY